MNVYQLTLLVLLYTVVTFLISCVSATDTTATDAGPVEIEDIMVVPASGNSSLYAAATVTTEVITIGYEYYSVIVISGIPNLADDTRLETLTVSIADKTEPPTYTAEPASITIPAADLNPMGSSATNIMGYRESWDEFDLTPVGGGEPTWFYGIVLRLEAGG